MTDAYAKVLVTHVGNTGTDTPPRFTAYCSARNVAYAIDRVQGAGMPAAGELLGNMHVLRDGCRDDSDTGLFPALPQGLATAHLLIEHAGGSAPAMVTAYTQWYGNASCDVRYPVAPGPVDAVEQRAIGGMIVRCEAALSRSAQR